MNDIENEIKSILAAYYLGDISMKTATEEILELIKKDEEV